jgi:hypothetical protein
MKLTYKDCIVGLFFIIIIEPLKGLIKKILYYIELGGKNGFEVDGLLFYEGRYSSVEKIVELAYRMKESGECFSFYFPAKEYNYKYNHRITISWIDKKNLILFEYNEASDQCGVYAKEIYLNSLENEINSLSQIIKEPTSFGYTYFDN